MIYTQSVIILMFLSLFPLSSCKLPEHLLWFTKYLLQPSSIPSLQWSYCDLKCQYLQNYYPYDFIVIWFKQNGYRPDFMACYIKDISKDISSKQSYSSNQQMKPNYQINLIQDGQINMDNSQKQNNYILWSDKVENKFFQSICGMDDQDYLQNSQQYTVVKITNVGRKQQLQSKSY